jgi:methyl-accepting chemotaxis protein
MQQHRGLSSGYLNGNVGMKEKVEAKGAEVDAAVTSLGTALPTALSAFPGWTESVAEWRQIRASGLDWGPPENLRRHTAVIERMLAFMVDIADHSELTLEGDIAPYYMMDTVVSKMRHARTLGLTRARGTGALARKEVSPLLRIDLIASMALMEGNLKAQSVNLDKVGRYAPQLQGRLREASIKFSDDTASLFALVRKDILGEEFTTDPDRYFAITTALIRSGVRDDLRGVDSNPGGSAVFPCRR